MLSGCRLPNHSLIINLISGAIGGNVAGAILKDLSLGTTGNSIVGILGLAVILWLMRFKPF